MRTILSLAIMAASPVLSSTLTGAFGGGNFLGLSVGRLITGGVNLLGRLALNALAPPGRGRFAGNLKESPTLFIQGARNQAIPFGRVPKVLGKHRFVPPLAALPYTETQGNDQYIRMLFVWGYGPLRISDIKIGETPIESFVGVELETRQGYANDAPITLFSNSVIQNSLDVVLRQTDGYALRTTEDNAEEISVDITFPRGLVRFSGAQKLATTVQIELQYAPTGTNNWSLGATSFTSFAGRNITLPAAPESYTQNGQTVITQREDRICMDAASGTLQIVQGVTWRLNIDPLPTLAVLASTSLPLARVIRLSNDSGVIAPSQIIDDRQFEGGVVQNSTDFAVSYAGTPGSMTIAAGGLKFPGFIVTAKQTSALRRALTLKVPKGKYDVRLKRLTIDAIDDNTFDEVSWTALRTIRAESPVRMNGLAMTALRIKATDQLNGVIDRLNGVVESIVPDWTGTVWQEQQTSNPAALFRHVLQSNANARPLSDSRLDINALQNWYTYCQQNNFEYNAVIDYDISVSEVLENIAAAGRASPTIIDGKWSVVVDKPATVPVQHFTPVNTVGFRGEKSFDDMPHALRVRFINRDKGWLQDERLVFDDGYTASNATKYETLELNGITNADGAWKAGRYHIATARLRPESYSFYTDIEHIVCTRGDLIRFTHDVPLFGAASARVVSLQSSGGFYQSMTLDNEVTLQPAKNYAVRMRLANGASFTAAISNITGTTKTLVLQNPVPVSQGLNSGDIVMFGEAGQESVELIVRSIEPQSDMRAKITCIDAAPAVHAADIGTIPAHNSQVSIPLELQKPPTPMIATLQSGEEVLIRNIDGSLSNRIVVTLTPANAQQDLQLRVLIKAKEETSFIAAQVTQHSQVEYSILNVDEGEIYDLQFRYATNNSIYSDPLVVTDYVVSGGLAPPARVENFNLNMNGETARLSWDANTDYDLSHYILKFSSQIAGAEWGSAVELATSIPADATSYVAPSLYGTYLIKAVDIGGRQSEEAALVVSTVAGLSGYNAVLNVDDAPFFAGDKTNVVFVDQGLRLTGVDTIDVWSNFDTVQNTDIGLAGYHTDGTYSFAAVQDLGSVYTSRLTADLMASGYRLNTLVDTWAVVENVESWDQNAGSVGWDVKLELRLTQDDPLASPTWSEWQPLIMGDYTARAFEFRLRLYSLLPDITPFVQSASIQIDMPDRIDSRADISGTAALQTISFNRAFRQNPAVAICGRNMQTGDYFTLTNIQSGQFDIGFYNAAGTPVARVFDYIAKGFGERV